MGRLSNRTWVVGTLSTRPMESKKTVSHGLQNLGGVAAGVAVCLLLLLSAAPTSLAATRHFDFDIALVNYTRNCVTKPILAVNGQYPGPTIRVSEGDRVVVRVTNSGNENVTIHWHGIRQWLSGWQDGAGYITQCPIQPGDYFVYDFIVSDQRGTLLWHAHVNWVRSTVYGSFIIDPLIEYPFPTPDKEFTVLIGEWWDENVEEIRKKALVQRGPFEMANILTINGFPGVLSGCSETEGMEQLEVEPGKTYLLRIINAAVNSEIFFGVANHVLTVVEVDSNYVKPFTLDYGISITPGRTMNVLVTADQPAGSYYMLAKYHTPRNLLGAYSTFTPEATTALFKYKETSEVLVNRYPFYPSLPPTYDVEYSVSFEGRFRSRFPQSLQVNSNVRRLIFTVGAATEYCNASGPNPCPTDWHSVAAVQNITFQEPQVAILQAYYYNIPGVYTPDFPDMPLHPFNYTDPVSPSPPDQVSEHGTRVTVLEYGTTVQLVLQDVHNGGFMDHPFHLHGYFFHVIGRGFGNFDPETDPNNFNYNDPPTVATISMPLAGWVAIQFEANNPGAWFFHCHIDIHNSLGMAMVFIVKNGVGINETLPPPPRLNQC